MKPDKKVMSATQKIATVLSIIVALSVLGIIVVLSMPDSIPPDKMARIILECRLFLEQQKDLDVYLGGEVNDTLYPTISSLDPQYIAIFQHNEQHSIVNIQITGGFSHTGLLVVLTSENKNYVPRISNFRIVNLGQGVFHYFEMLQIFKQ